MLHETFVYLQMESLCFEACDNVYILLTDFVFVQGEPLY